MAIILEGGCRVTEMREGEPAEHGTLRVWSQIGKTIGAQAISLRVLEFSPGLSPGIRNEDCDEILYVLNWDRERFGGVRSPDVTPANSVANMFIDGWPFALTEQTGIYLRPGQTLTVDNPGVEPLVLISSRCPDPNGAANQIVAPVIEPLLQTPAPSTVRLVDRP